MQTTSRIEAVGSRDTAHITGHEWRWVIIVACVLILLAFFPLIWVALRGTPGWQFMGALHNYLDGATYLAKMRIGYDGGLAVHFLHTPEIHDGAFIMLVYPLLGSLARLLDLPLLVMFHAARCATSLVMYAAIYQLGATIWMNVGTRRIFFAIASVGSGLGWVLGPLLGASDLPDLVIPEAFPVYSTFVNVHFPLSIACLALLVSLLIAALRPNVGANIDPMWWGASLLSFALSLLYPQSLVPLGAALGLYIAYDWIKRRTLERRALLWSLAVVLPALPVALYYLTIVQVNPALTIWNQQNQTLSPSPLAWLIGLGLPLVIALPALVRAVQRMEQDGDRLMLLWLVAIVVTMYLPTGIQRRFSVGIMLPVAYFATRALQDVWLTRIRRRARPLLVVGVVLIALTPLLMLFLPALPAMIGSPEYTPAALFLDADYVRAYQWIDNRTDQDDVVLAAPDGSIWLPGWAGARVVYAHQYETLNAADKRAEVSAWYTAVDSANCAALLDRYNVRYIVQGPEEAQFAAELRAAPTVCFEMLQQVVQFGDVTVYTP
ncbi:MAG: hypothetical protein SF162_00425 [bacterium]|nr:hypothetical protein [bacterium]